MGCFAVVYYGNTGSSWLVQTLGSAPGVVIPAFEPLESWAWKAGSDEKLVWLRNAFTPPEEREGAAFDAWLEGLAVSPQFEKLHTKDFSTVGLKMTGGAISDTSGLLGLLRELATKVVLLQRRNRVKHAVSLYRYHEESKSQFELAGVRPPSRVRWKRFDYWLQDSIRLHTDSEVFKSQALSTLGPAAITTVQYEEFVGAEGKAEVIDRLARFLEVEPPSLDSSHFQKATPDDLRSAVLNYERLRRRYRRTPLAVYFEE